MDYTIILSFWLLTTFYTCCSLYCFATYQPVKQEAQQPELASTELVEAEIRDNEGQLAAVKRSMSPNRPLYYASIRQPKPIWHYDKNFHIVNHYKASYPSYNNNGFGYPHNGYGSASIAVGRLTPLLCSIDWLNAHYAKYPAGILPEQTIERRR